MKAARGISGLLIDLDGVLYVGGEVIPGALEALAELRAAEIPFRFVTNTSTRTAASLQKKLARLGFVVREEEIFSAVTATLGYLRALGGPPPSVHAVVRDAVLPDFREFPREDEQPDYVVIGDIGANWSYGLMNRIFRQLHAGARLLAMHRNRFFMAEDGLHVDIGCFVAGLEHVSGQEAVVIGKPNRAFFEAALASLGCQPEEVGMIGDDLESDVGAAQRLGIRGIQVRTGKFSQSQLEASSVVPDAVLGSISELPSWLREY
ncbi:MAG: TIGR01458 family HAD-type hydrolase [Verrucomicrobiota bacterium]